MLICFYLSNKSDFDVQIQLCLTHKTTTEMQHQLHSSSVPIQVYAALHDQTIPTPDQLKMAKRLGAQCYEASTAHLCVIDDFDTLTALQLSLIASTIPSH